MKSINRIFIVEVHIIAAIRRLLLPIRAKNRRTTLFRFETSRVTALSKMVVGAKLLTAKEILLIGNYYLVLLKKQR